MFNSKSIRRHFSQLEENHNTYNAFFSKEERGDTMNELKGWPFEPVHDEVELFGGGEGPGPCPLPG